MRRHVVRFLSLQNTLIRRPAIPPPIHSLSVNRLRCLHTSSPHFKQRDSGSKSRHREEKKAAKEKLEETLSSAEQWLDTHNPDRPDVIQNKKAMLLEQTDPFEWDAFVQNLKDIVSQLRKEGSLIRQGKSDPEMLRGLQVELPDNLGGKQRFLDVATVGPKPGDARSLLVSVFDVEYTKHIVRAIAQSYPTLNPQPAPKNEMQLIIPLPPMTKETRLENQKKAKDLADKQKTLVRNARQDQLKLIKSAFKEDPAIGKDAVSRVEKDTDKEMKKTLEEIDRITEQIKRDIMVA